MDESRVPNRALVERVAHCLGRSLTGWRPVAGGYTVATRWLVTCADGSSAFVKGATDALTATWLLLTWLRLEYGVYAHVQAPFLPMLRAWDDDGVYPLLVLEDLSGAVWYAPRTMTPRHAGPRYVAAGRRHDPTSHFVQFGGRASHARGVGKRRPRPRRHFGASVLFSSVALPRPRHPHGRRSTSTTRG